MHSKPRVNTETVGIPAFQLCCAHLDKKHKYLLEESPSKETSLTSLKPFSDYSDAGLAATGDSSFIRL